jgi:hypothetical protein
MMNWFGRLFPSGVSVQDRLGRLGRDLMRLEVNTILKESMTAEPTPPWPHALLGLLREYAGFLHGRGLPVSDYVLTVPPARAGMRGTTAKPRQPWRDILDQPPPHDRTGIRIDIVTVDALRWAALDCSLALQRRPEKADRAAIAERIVGSCDELKNILSRAAAAKNIPTTWAAAWAVKEEEIDTTAAQGPDRKALVEAMTDADMAAGIEKAISIRDLSVLRKMWEVGTEIVVAQTVIQLDGDVITRLRPDLAKPEGIPTIDIHRRGVEVALSSWRYVVETALRLVSGSRT